MLLTSRKLLQRKLLDVECDLRGTLRNFGLKVGAVSTRRYEARIRELVEGFPKLAARARSMISDSWIVLYLIDLSRFPSRKVNSLCWISL